MLEYIWGWCMAEDAIVPWGESWHPGIKMSRGLDCPSCGWSWLTGSLAKYNNIIGFSDQAPFETRGLGIKILIGILIIECPKCFEKYCFHTDASFARMCKEYSNKWPKSGNDDV